MARPKAGVTLEMRAKEALVFGEDGHWWSTLTVDKRRYRIRIGDRFTSQLLVLWQIYFGDPVGLLSNACGRAECVNPYHYRDESDRQQLMWRTEAGMVDIADELAREGLSLDDVETFGIRVISIHGLSPSDILDAYGMTNDMGCYECGGRFDPIIEEKLDDDGKPIKILTPGNGVICPGCFSRWTEKDFAVMEDSNACGSGDDGWVHDGGQR